MFEHYDRGRILDGGPGVARSGPPLTLTAIGDPSVERGAEMGRLVATERHLPATAHRASRL
jgi:hypothetical protein